MNPIKVKLKPKSIKPKAAKSKHYKDTPPNSTGSEPPKLKFYLDEHFHKAIASNLSNHGIDVLTVEGAGQSGFSDEEQLHFAWVNNRVMVTKDSDYLAFDKEGVQHSGIVYVPSKRIPPLTIGQLVGFLHFLWNTMPPDEMKGYIEYARPV